MFNNGLDRDVGPLIHKARWYTPLKTMIGEPTIRVTKIGNILKAIYFMVY